MKFLSGPLRSRLVSLSCLMLSLYPVDAAAMGLGDGTGRTGIAAYSWLLLAISLGGLSVTVSRSHSIKLPAWLLCTVSFTYLLPGVFSLLLVVMAAFSLLRSNSEIVEVLLFVMASGGGWIVVSALLYRSRFMPIAQHMCFVLMAIAFFPFFVTTPSFASFLFLTFAPWLLISLVLLASLLAKFNLGRVGMVTACLLQVAIFVELGCTTYDGMEAIGFWTDQNNSDTLLMMLWLPLFLTYGVVVFFQSQASLKARLTMLQHTPSSSSQSEALEVEESH